MAKGYNKGGLDILIWEVFRGTGRQFGRDISKEVTKQVKGRVLDNTSKYRKYIGKFTLTGTVKTSIQKMYQLIDQFHEEYTTTSAILQSKVYMETDIDFINEKISMIRRMCFEQNEFQSLQNLEEFWNSILDIVTEVKK
jgi:hypothetical protein